MVANILAAWVGTFILSVLPTHSVESARQFAQKSFYQEIAVQDTDYAKQNKHAKVPDNVCASLYNKAFKKAKNSCIAKGGSPSACSKSAKKKAVKKALAQDSDGDCQKDEADNCPSVANADQADSDGDGLGNLCDNCAAVSNADQADGDADGVGNVCDNCSAISNPDQSDTDVDGTGDLCEITDLVAGGGDRVHIFYDVTADPFKTSADVTLNNATSQIAIPMSVIVHKNRLYVGNAGTNAITVYNNFTSLSSNAAPSLTLNNAVSMISSPSAMVIADGDLYVANTGNDTIGVFRNVDSLTNNQAPDVVLDNAVSGVDSPTGLTVGNNILYVGNLGSSEVLVFNGASSLVSAHAPDVVLNNAGSRIQAPYHLELNNNELYVSDAGTGVLRFSPADALVNSQTPDYVLNSYNTPGLSVLCPPADSTIVGGRLFVSALFGCIPNDPVHVYGFDNLESLGSGFPPSLTLTPAGTFLVSMGQIESANGVLFYGVTSLISVPGFYGYTSPGTIHTNDSPDLFGFDGTAPFSPSYSAIFASDRGAQE